MTMEDVVKCKVCGDHINFDTGYHFTSCKCGAIAVDGGPDYTRIIGKQDNWEIIAVPIERS